jgi:hypothetical protein
MSLTTKTAMAIALGRVARPREIYDMTMFPASDRSAYVILTIDGERYILYWSPQRRTQAVRGG